MILFSLYFSSNSFAQKHLPNNYFSENNSAEVILESQTNIYKLLNQEGIYLDHGSSKNHIQLYITEEGYQYLVKKKLEYTWIQAENPIINMMSLKEYKKLRLHKEDCLSPPNKYPSYEAYEQMMYDFEAKYPEICKIINLGTLQSGRKILMAVIGDNPLIPEDEPNFLYTSTMHGDELAGYVTMLNTIDHLLCNYGTDDRVTRLVNEINIFINPLANPNGTYFGGNDSVLDSRRFNGAFVDLNRNFPDPERGINPDNKPYQEETLIFMDFAKKFNINLACNIHSGAEVVNYPWDTYEHTHADDDWWIKVSRDYADTVQARSTQEEYFTDSNNGITNGYEWFEIKGGRQDYMNYFERAREFTLELTDTKKLNSDLLPEVWEWNRPALVNYLEESLFGLRGTIVDCDTKMPIEAEVLIEGHDIDNSSVFSNIDLGAYFRYLNEGQYEVSYTAPGYDTIIAVVDIFDKVSTRKDIELCADPLMTDKILDLENIQIIQENNKLIIKDFSQNTNNDFENVEIYNLEGRKLMSESIESNEVYLSDNIVNGIYLIHLSTKNQVGSKKLFIK